MIRLKINLNKVQIKEWCMRNKYSVITTGEILKKRFGLKSTKEIISKINFPGNPDYFDDSILKGNLNQQLIYKDEDEEKELEDIICSIFECLFYLGDNKISKTKIKSPYKKDDIILSNEGYLLKYVTEPTEVSYDVTVEYSGQIITKTYKTLIKPKEE